MNLPGRNATVRRLTLVVKPSIVYNQTDGQLRNAEWSPLHLFQVVLSVVTGAFIGLVTNGLAIAMLFRPWHPWRIGRWRVPLTPGLIPRRREEIAHRLGEIVQEHLLPVDSVQKALRTMDMEGAFRKALDHLAAWVEAEGLARLANAVADWAEGCRSVGRRDAPEESETRQAVPGVEQGGVSRDLFARFVPGLVRRLADSVEGAELIRELIGRGLEFAAAATQELKVRRGLAEEIQRWLQHQGWLGRLVGALSAEDRVAEELLRALRDWLTAPGTAGAVEGWVVKELLPGVAGLLEQRPSGAAPRLIREVVCEQLADREWVEAQLGEVWRWVDKRRDRWEPRLRTWILTRVDILLPHLWRRVPLARMVEEQVNRFPLPELERLILDVARKELAMITWMGAVLGGLVGFAQAAVATLG
ncbi:DUF445 domain-containing protein [Kyrpidia spormannii]|uniref:DUF445 domain-containing protein n=1 Tax=Kyrpidia spormannii TaxID=2055160 RepID=A0A6F9EE97_9BACL|nr:DUF445 family protein [Kyrpidia spormannii]CAB3394896.1 conserved protein of unknown function [Kyrpidia spormannii]